jgi:MFS family permease
MGVFFTIYYAVMMIAPPIGGIVGRRHRHGRRGLCVRRGLSLACVVLLAAFRVWTDGAEPRATLRPFRRFVTVS